MSLPENFRRAMERKPVYEDNYSRAKRKSADPKPAICLGALGKEEVAGSDPPRSHISITSYRVRLADADALVPKYHIDALRYAGVLVDDTTRHITLQTEQIRVKTKAEEKTVIEITQP